MGKNKIIKKNYKNLAKRGAYIYKKEDFSSRPCLYCGKIYSPAEIISEMKTTGIYTPLILVLNWCSRECYDADALEQLRPKFINYMIDMLKKIFNIVSK